MRFKRHLLPTAALAVLALAFVLAPEALAQFGLSEAAKGTGIPKTTEITVIIGRILRLVLSFVGTLFLLLMVYAGFLWMTARGDSKKVDQAKQLITGAIIGVLIVASAYAITAFVLTAATGVGDTTTESSTAGDEPTQCADKSCSTASDCQGNACFTGTCFCSSGGEEHPASGLMLGTSANPCTVGSCGKTN